MRLADVVRLALANLLRNRTRSAMTLVGVMIGVAALVALLSYGTGLQQNARGEFETLELYNTLRVTSHPSPVGSLGEIAYRSASPRDSSEGVPITDSLLRAVEALPGVLAAYPEVAFPVQIQRGDREVLASAEAVPMAFGALPAYQPVAGAFFRTPRDSSLLISRSMAERLGYADPDAAVGDTLTLITAALDVRALRAAASALAFGMGTLPIRQRAQPMRVAGVLAEEGQALSGFVRVLVPLERARAMRKITFFSTLDLLLSRGGADGYAAARVQLASRDALAPVRAAIEQEGLFVMSLRDQFQQVERLFVVMDLGLAVIGMIALLVATIGIANTMMMNVMERTREIGVMKAVGGEERDLRRLFLAESACIGLMGCALGIVTGLSVTALIQWAIDGYLGARALPPIDVFYAAPAMLAAVAGVALGVSVLAGVLPARRAARVDPLTALRNL